MDWSSIFEKGASALGPIAASVVSYKLALGKKSKRIEFLDRMTKEVGLRDALLKLDVAATEDGSENWRRAEQRAYDDAQQLANQVSLERRIKDPVVELFAQESTRNRMIPAKYEGLTVRRATRARWWRYMALYSIFLVLYGTASARFAWFALHTELSGTNAPRALFFVVALLVISLIAGKFRRRAFKIAIED